MNSLLKGAAAGLLGAIVIAVLCVPSMAPPPTPAPVVPPPPAPVKPKKPAPPCPRCPQKVGPRSVGADEVSVDLLAMPGSLRPRNVGGSDGAGLCVFTSIMYAARWQNEARLKDFQTQMKQEKGGGWPEKVDKMIAKYGPGTLYIQYNGKDPTLIEKALATGRVPCITWQANHMLCCVALNAERGAILDNNAPDRVQWFSRAVFLQKWTQGGGGWVVVLLAPPPPPMPRNVEGLNCPCSPQCTCGCAQGRPCTCGNSPISLDGVFRAESPEGFSVNGRHANMGEALALIEADLPDDSGKRSLTIIGPDRAKIFASLPADLLAVYHVQCYDPADATLGWAVKGFVTTGNQVILQSSTGVVLLRVENPGPDLVEKLRTPGPYDPTKDPTGVGGAPSPDTSATGVILAMAACVAVYRRKQ